MVSMMTMVLWVIMWYAIVLDLPLVYGTWYGSVTDARVRISSASILAGPVEIKCDDEWGELKLCGDSGLSQTGVNNMCDSHRSNLYKHFQGDYNTNWEPASSGLDWVVLQTAALGSTCVKETIGACTRTTKLTCWGRRGSGPYIDINSQAQTVYQVNNVVTMMCKVYGGIPKPTVQWTTRPGSRVLDSQTNLWSKSATATRPTFYTVVKVNLTYEDNKATYVCGFTQTRYSSGANTITLNVEYAPQMGGQETKTVNEFEDVQFDCTVDSNPVSAITWYNNKGNQMPLPAGSTSTFSKLSLTNVQPSDIGSYKCQAVNIVRGVQQSRNVVSFLKVKYAPRVTGQENKTVDEFYGVQFECTVDSNPVSVITWYNNKGEIIPPPHESNDTYSKLSLTDAKPSDIGPYTCGAENSVGGVQKFQNVVSFLEVKYAPRMGDEQNKTVDEFDDVYFECSVDSNPVSVITWYNNIGETIPSPIDSNGTYSKLTLPAVKRAEIGPYTCRAENYVGGVQKSKIIVNNLYIKSIPKMCLFKQNVMLQNNSASLMCAVTGVPTPTLAWYSGVSPIRGDISDTNDTVNPYMTTSVLTVSRLDTLDLKAGFVCRASNCVGETQKNVIVRRKKTCRCNIRSNNLKLPFKNMTAEVLQQAMEETKEELTVKTEKLTVFVNKKISVPDRRASSIGLGVIGIAILGFVGLAMIAGDLLTLVLYVRTKMAQSTVKPKADYDMTNIEIQEIESNV